ncbi:MAG TPA: efflux RND transporter periplasmic adaptor subunit [Isosphaeraceae bacterium]|nr:efflux RND transporter periplasmic adaptor subunit [Isosphaeraceae bacterium]
MPPPPAVKVFAAQTMEVPIEADPTGTTRALQQVSLRARVRGFLKEIHFKEGDDVKVGQLLFVIDEEPFQVALEAARAQLAEAEASLQKAKDSQAREVAAAQLAVDQALLALARVEEYRQRALFNRNAASQDEVDRAAANRQKSEATVQADKASLAQSKTDYDVNILAAQASVDQAKANVRDAEINLSYCRMSAPIGGRIGEAKVKIGNLVGPASSGGEYTELATIQQLDPMGVDVRPSSRYLDRANELISQGLTFRFSRPGVDGLVEHPYAGQINFIDNAIDPGTSTFLVKGTVPNPDRSLLPGEYVKIHLTVGLHENAVVVPEQAVMEGQAGQTVYVVARDGTVKLTRVQAADTYKGLRVITSGLKPGNRVVVEGIQLVRPGQKTNPKPFDDPALAQVVASGKKAEPEQASKGAADSRE